MSIGSAIGGFVRTLVIAAASGVAALGLLVVFHPFDAQRTPPAANSTASSAFQSRIEAKRVELRETEDAIEDLRSRSLTLGTDPEPALRAQYEAQIAAAAERRDLALRHAGAIRQGLKSGVTVSSLAEIRDSVVIGQLLSQQSALDAQLAVEGARLRPMHPTMRALAAQKSSLQVQIRQEAANIATALEAEAKLDDAQIDLLRQQLPDMASTAAPEDAGALEIKAATQRAELDSLVDAYFDIPPANASPAPEASDPLSLVNLIVIGVAALGTIVFRIALALRRRRHTQREDESAWEDDGDIETGATEVAETPLRKAS